MQMEGTGNSYVDLSSVLGVKQGLEVGYNDFFLEAHVLNKQLDGRIYLLGIGALSICWIVSGFCGKHYRSVYIAPVGPSTTTLRGI